MAARRREIFYGSTCFNFPPCFGCSFLHMGPTFANVCLCWFFRCRTYFCRILLQIWGVAFSLYPSGSPGPLALWPFGSLALQALWPSWLSGHLTLLALWPPILALLALWSSWPSGSLALLVLWHCCPLAFVPCFGPLCLAFGLCALLWAFAPCVGPLCLALGLCALLWAFVPCFGSLCLALGHCALLWALCRASDLIALPVAFLRRSVLCVVCSFYAFALGLLAPSLSACVYRSQHVSIALGLCL